MEFFDQLLRLYLLDRWTVVHVVFFFLLSVASWKFLAVRRLGHLLLLSLTLGLSWELIEARIECLWGPYGEPPLNRWLSDPIADGLGAILAWAVLRKGRRGSI